MAPETILLVEDEPEVAAVLEEYLQGLGYPVRLAFTGAEARAALAAAPVAMLLLDLNLPDLDGVVLMREAQGLAPPPDVIVITGHPGLESAIVAVETGAAGYITKPFDLQRVGALVEGVVERRRLRRDNARLQAQLAVRLRETQAHLAISSAITSTLDLPEALRRICRELVRLVGADTGAVYLHDPEAYVLRPVAAYRAPKEHVERLAGATLPLLEQGFYLPLWAERRTLFSTDVASDPRFGHELFRSVPHQSGLLIPLLLGDGVGGAFYLAWWTERRAFTDAELARLDAVAAQVALVLRNARLYEAAKREQDRLRVLAQVSRRIAAVYEPDEILSLIVNEASRLVGADASAVRLVDGADLVLAAVNEAASNIQIFSRTKAAESLSGLVVAGTQPVAIEDLADSSHDPRHARGALDLGFRGFLGVALRGHGRTIGALNVFTRSPRRFTVEETSLLSAFADQASLAIEKGRLYAESERRRRASAALAEVGRLVSETLDTVLVGQRIADAVRNLLGTLASAVYHLDPASGNLVIDRVSGDPGPAFRPNATFPSGTGVVGLAVAERRPVQTPNLLADPRVTLSPDRRALLEQGRHRAVLAVPLMVEDRVIGALGVGDIDGRVFDDEQVRLVEAFATQAAIALRNARLHAGSERRRSEAEVVARLVSDVNASLDLRVVLQRVAEAARELCGADLARVALRRDGTDEMTFHSWSGDIGGGDQTLVVEPGQGVGGRTLQTGQPCRTDDCTADPEIGKDLIAGARADAIVAEMCVPIRVRDRIEGLLFVDNRRPAPFTDRDEAVLVRLADHGAAAIQNARLYDEMARRRREAEVLAELVRGISGSLDLDAVLQRVAEGARELCGTDMSMIALREPGSDAMVVRYRAGAQPNAYAGREIEPGKGVGGQVLLSGKPFRSEDTAVDTRISKDYLQWAPQEASLASMAVPIRIGQSIEGLLYAQHRTPRPFSDRDEAILGRLAAQAAVAIGNAQLFAREQEARADAEQAASAMRASEEQYRALAEGSIQGMYIHQDSIIRFANRSLARMLGYDSVEELIGREYLFAMAPREHPRIEGYRRARLRGEPAPTRYEAEAVRKDGSPIWMEIVVSLVPWEGRPAVLGTFLDITERKRAEEALRLSEQANARLFREAEHRKTLLEQVFASTSDGILVLDLHQRVTALNRRGGDLLGVDPGTAVGQPLAELAEWIGGGGVWSDAHSRALLAAARGGHEARAGDLEMRLPRAQTLHWQSAPTRDATGATVGVTITFRDVTEEREVSRMKSDFVSFVTHQLRTPLSGIRWMLELASQEAGVPADATACIADARQAAERLIGLVNDLLDISRLESGKLSLVLKPTSLAELTQAVLNELAPLVRERAHRLSVAGVDATPTVVVDPQLLRQAILNLVSNAIKYQHPGGEIAIRMGREHGEARWEVSDRGIGIPAEAQRRLFEKFYRADNAVTLETEGTGLGLYLVRLIIERFGGRIWCESEDGRGSTFVFTLPLRESETP